ncbi:MAG: multicopper oxidase family protein [Gemmatimonadales bacterium]
MPVLPAVVALTLAAFHLSPTRAVPPLECPRLSASGGSTDLYCIHLIPAPGFASAGSVELSWTGGPFTVDVTADGTQQWQLRFSLQGLPDTLLRGRRSGFVAWAASPSMARIVRLGVVHAGEMDVGTVALDRFLILISAEPDTSVREWQGRMVLRGESAGNRLRPADSYQFFLGVAGDRTVARMHDHHSAQPDAMGWTDIPMFPGLDMLPAEMALRPAQQAYLPAFADAPTRRPHEVVRLHSGDTLTLVAGPIRRTVAGREYTMLGFNGQSPGPLIQAERGAEVVIRLLNHLGVPTTVHWHGIRLDNQFDGVPDQQQPAVAPGAEFFYRVRFPDAGIFWYHPHVREDVQQDLGLYGNLFVTQPGGAGSPGPAHEKFLVLDDLLVGEDGLVPYGGNQPTHAAMGRFGNVMLVNGETGWQDTVRGGEVVRFYLTNVASTRTFNLSFGAGTRTKVVGSDQGNYAREVWTESVVIAPAERYIVDVQFPVRGKVALVNRVQAIDHLYGKFFSVTDTLGRIAIAGSTGALPAFSPLRSSSEFAVLDSLVSANAEVPPEHTLELRVSFAGLPFVSEQLMRLDSIYFNPVEWEGTMPGMNWATTGTDTRWILRDVATGNENMEIHWHFRRGSFSRIRLIGARNALHGMQHPIHLHGQRFVVLAVNGKRSQNPVWKDTVLVPAGTSVDILAELSNPGSWMLHCHIAEHMESGMMMHFDVEE